MRYLIGTVLRTLSLIIQFFLLMFQFHLRFLVYLQRTCNVTYTHFFKLFVWWRELLFFRISRTSFIWTNKKVLHIFSQKFSPAYLSLCCFFFLELLSLNETYHLIGSIQLCHYQFAFAYLFPIYMIKFPNKCCLLFD